MDLIKSISGIRGIYNLNLNEEIVSQFSNSFISNQNKGKILLARDTRPHGESLYQAIQKSLLKKNVDVISCGIIPTPTAQFIVKQKKLSGGIVITASHNPIEWNGLKFIDSDGCFLNKDKMDFLFNNKKTFNSNNDKGTLTVLENAMELHIQNVINLKCIHFKKIKQKNIKVVIDSVNGAAYKILPALLEKFNCNVIKINCENNGEFPRGTEPIPSNLVQLQEAVIKHDADIGLATDPDADRLAIIDNNGIAIGEESTLILAVESFLKFYKNEQTIITNLSTSMGVQYIAKKYCSNVIQASVGEINVVEKMKELKSEIGGEGNGGVILRESHLGRDSLVASALILNHLALSNISLHQIMKDIPKFEIIKDKITIEKKVDFKKLKNHFSKYNDTTIYEEDGLKIIWDKKWIHIRKSNTEPIIRIISEAKTTKIAKELISSVKDMIFS